LCTSLFFRIFYVADLFCGAHTAFHSAHTKQALRGNVACQQLNWFAQVHEYKRDRCRRHTIFVHKAPRTHAEYEVHRCLFKATVISSAARTCVQKRLGVGEMDESKAYVEPVGESLLTEQIKHPKSTCFRTRSKLLCIHDTLRHNTTVRCPRDKTVQNSVMGQFRAQTRFQ